MCHKQIGGCEEVKAVITGFLDGLCPPVTCDIGHSAQCIDNLLLRLKFYEELYVKKEKKTCVNSEGDPCDAPEPPTPVVDLISLPVDPKRKRHKKTPGPKSGSSSGSGSGSKSSKSSGSGTGTGGKHGSRRRRDLRDLFGDILREKQPITLHRYKRSAQVSSSGSEDIVGANQPIILQRNKRSASSSPGSEEHGDVAIATVTTSRGPQQLPEEPGFCW